MFQKIASEYCNIVSEPIADIVGLPEVVPEKSDVFMLAVPTPFKGNYEPDLSYIKSAAKSIARVLEKGNLVILESTSPVVEVSESPSSPMEESDNQTSPTTGNSYEEKNQEN